MAAEGRQTEVAFTVRPETGARCANHTGLLQKLARDVRRNMLTGPFVDRNLDRIGRIGDGQCDRGSDRPAVDAAAADQLRVAGPVNGQLLQRDWWIRQRHAVRGVPVVLGQP